jgi:hypothetical protein
VLIGRRREPGKKYPVKNTFFGHLKIGRIVLDSTRVAVLRRVSKS